ncbi:MULTISPECIES: hypothetical protein [unclassified Streptomyces]|uniref:hypothetical protein n=1 Tax=unclassified Streptomyces TaxID=2593676 RepID=UPI002DDBCA5E|nr:hypothetical protein [Streptomyces sp. NBC_01750]WSB01183.1 hypothetical protein OIE54_18805 [Streptomyces sp. NBC_01794]WSD34462.1 hypothetical protein OG966_22800 [Streptomyces sp. NBC_01750]
MERRSLESAAAIYYYLRGLLSIPVGAMIIFAGLGNLAWGPLRHAWVFMGCLLVAAAAYLLITRYYNENYGRVALPTRAQTKGAVATVVSAVVVAGGVQADWSLDLPLSLTAASFALIMVVYYAVGVGLRAHHTIICGALLAAGLVPVWGGAGADSKVNLGLILTGAATIATGIFDHRALNRAFGPSEELTAGNSNAGV